MHSTPTPDQADVSVQSIQLKGDLDDLETCRRFCQELVIKAKIGEPTEAVIGRLQLAATEALVNVIKHGTKNEKQQPIACQSQLSNSSISLEILHCGKAFVPESIPNIEEPQENGMGLFLIQQCVDNVSYGQTADGRQSITLTIHI